MGVAKIGARPWCVRLLGGFARPLGPIEALGVQRLLAYVALQERSVTRTRVAGDLWPEAGPRAGTNLRSTLWRSNRLGPLLTCTPWSLRLAPGVRVDVADLTAAAEQMHAGGLADAPFRRRSTSSCCRDGRRTGSLSNGSACASSSCGSSTSSSSTGPTAAASARPSTPLFGRSVRAPARVVPPPPDPPVRRLRQPHGRPDALRGVRHPAPPEPGPHTGARHHGPGRAVPEAAASAATGPGPRHGAAVRARTASADTSHRPGRQQPRGPVTPGPRRPAGEGAVLDPRRQRDDR